jgi:hypothetical protein
MKAILITLLLGSALFAGACSDKQPDSATQSTPNPSLKSDAARLQQATAKAAEQKTRRAVARAQRDAALGLDVI